MARPGSNPIDIARRALTGLLKTKDSGFEGLLCQLLSARLGASLRLCSSGQQFGRDMGNGEIAVEAKRYGATRLAVRELAGEIVIAKQATKSLRLWILGTTRELPEQDFRTLEGVTEKIGVELAVVDWSPTNCPRLLTLIALEEVTARTWFEANAPDAWARVEGGLAVLQKRQEPFARVAKELDAIASGLALVARLRETLLRAVKTAVSDPSGRLSRELFGQRIDFACPEARAVPRRDVYRDLDRAYDGNDENAYAAVVAVGPEGVGKTWAVVAHAMQRWPDRPWLFFSSALIDESLRRNWEHRFVLAECIRRTVCILEDCDPRFREEEWIERLLSALERSAARTFAPIIILDGFNERQGNQWGALAASLASTIGEACNARLVVTTRPMPGARLARELRLKQLKIEVVEVGAFNEAEFAAACRVREIDAGQFDPETAKDLRNPRLFRIAADLLPVLAGAPVTRERVFLEYWRHRQEEAADTRLQPEEFDDLLRQHAKQAWGDLRLLKGERTLYFDAKATQEAARFAGVDEAVRDVADVVTSGFFEIGGRGIDGETHFTANRLHYVLGLSLHRRLLQVTDEAVDDDENRVRVSERLGEDLEPMFDTDGAGVILATALLAGCLQKTRNRAVTVGCLVHLLAQRNARNDEVAPTVRGMVTVAACADPPTFIAVVEEVDDRDPWLVEALRTALALSDEREVVAAALHRWLEGEGEQTVTTSLHVLAGHDLDPYRSEIDRRRDPSGEADLAFWLLMLDEASRGSPTVGAFDDEEEDEGDESDDADEGDVPSIYEEISDLLRRDLRDLSEAHETGDTDEENDEALTWQETLEPGLILPIPPSIGGDWVDLDGNLPAALGLRRDEHDPEVHLFHVQLLENRFAVSTPRELVRLSRAIFLVSPPPASPPNYRLAHRWDLAPGGLDHLIGEVLHDEVRLSRTLEWIQYFGFPHCRLAETTIRGLLGVLLDRQAVEGLRADIAHFLGASGDEAAARLLDESGWTPVEEDDTAVSLHASSALVPLCRTPGIYPRLRGKLVATILCDLVEAVPAADLPLVVADFERHVENCVGDLRHARYPTSRSASGVYLCPEGSDRRLPLATLEMSAGAMRRLAAHDPQLPLRWFEALFELRAIFVGDESVIEFLAELLVGIASSDPDEAARCLVRLLEHLTAVMADADDAVLVSERLIHVAFDLPFAGGLPDAVGHLVRLANDDAALLLIARAAKGTWRTWLASFCETERHVERPGRIARARTLQAMAGLPADALPEGVLPSRIEEHARRIEEDRRFAEEAVRTWIEAGPDEREALEIEFLEAATGQVLDLPDLERCGEIGRLFASRIRVHEQQQIEKRTGQLFGLPGPPTRFVAANSRFRVIAAGVNRQRRFAEPVA